jgi:hypothetical protein
MNARELRVWHFRRCSAARVTADKHEAAAIAWEHEHGAPSKFHRDRMRADTRRADFHRDAVLVMNTHPECVAAGTKAADDAQVFPDPNLRLGKS